MISAAAADEYASPERTAAAVGHYARARSLIVQALDEFEQGRKIARPDLLIDSDEFRISLVSRAEELNRVLDPQPKVTRSGVRFKGAPDLVRDPRSEKAPSGLTAPAATTSAPTASNSSQADTFGLPGRGALANGTKKEAAAADSVKAAEKPKVSRAAKKREADAVKIEKEAVKSELLTVSPDAEANQPAPVREPFKEEAVKPAADSFAAPKGAVADAAADEDPEVKQAIEQAIKERLDRIKAETDPAEVKH